MWMLSGYWSLNLLNVKTTLVIVPTMPVTTIGEGYRLLLVAGPTSGIAIVLVLANLAARAGGGITVITKFVLALFVPSLTVTVFVTVPISPNVGVTVMYQSPSIKYRKTILSA